MAQWTPGDIKAAKQSILLSTIYCVLRGTKVLLAAAAASKIVKM